MKALCELNNSVNIQPLHEPKNRFFDRYRVKFHLLFLYLFIVKVFLCKLLPPSTLKEGIEKGEWFMICKYGCPTYYFVLLSDEHYKWVLIIVIHVL